jgi:hypothetical protein
LLQDLGSWSPTLRVRAAKELAKRMDDVVPQLVKMLESKDLNARYGACLALQYLEKRAAPATDELIRQLSEKDMWLRTRAAFALTCVGEPARRAVPELLKLALVADKDDARDLQCRYLAFALFSGGGGDGYPRLPGLLASSLEGIDRELLYPVIRKMLNNPDGWCRSSLCTIFKTLGTAELKSLLPELVEVASTPAPSGEMFANGIRIAALQFMSQNKIPEGLTALLTNVREEGVRPDVLPFFKDYSADAGKFMPELKKLQKTWEALEKDQSWRVKDLPLNRISQEVIKALEEPVKVP